MKRPEKSLIKALQKSPMPMEKGPEQEKRAVLADGKQPVFHSAGWQAPGI